MCQVRGRYRASVVRHTAYAIALAAVATLALSCKRGNSEDAEPSTAVLRVGLGQTSATSPLNGLQQLAQIVGTVEGLARLTPEGHVEPWVAAKWEQPKGGRSLIVTLKSGVKFHDGTPVTGQEVASLLPAALRTTMGSTVEDLDAVRAVDAHSIEIVFRRPSPFLLEALEVQIKKPGPAIVGTGPFVLAPNSTTDLKANADYYLGRPQIGDVQIQMFPSVRTAWAELLRNRLDMLYEVGFDALDSLESSRSIAVFTYVRHYQYLLVLNNASPALRDKEVRRALNMAVDRQQLTQHALRGHGVPSTGPIPPRYWALPTELPAFTVDPMRAAEILRGRNLRFNCLLASDPANERMALELKRQFAAVGATMELHAAAQDEIYAAEQKGSFDAILTEAISSPTLLRLYQLWHSKSPGNPGGRWGNATTDAAFDRVRYTEDESTYRSAVADLHQEFINDPPAVFLAWTERARAIGRRFVVPSLESGRDPLAVMRLWTPHPDQRLASRN